MPCANPPAMKILSSPSWNTSEDNPGHKQILALKHVILPVMWMTEAEVREASFPLRLGETRVCIPAGALEVHPNEVHPEVVVVKVRCCQNVTTRPVLHKSVLERRILILVDWVTVETANSKPQEYDHIRVCLCFTGTNHGFSQTSGHSSKDRPGSVSLQPFMVLDHSKFWTPRSSFRRPLIPLASTVWVPPSGLGGVCTTLPLKFHWWGSFYVWRWAYNPDQYMYHISIHSLRLPTPSSLNEFKRASYDLICRLGLFIMCSYLHVNWNEVFHSTSPILLLHHHLLRHRSHCSLHPSFSPL